MEICKDKDFCFFSDSPTIAAINNIYDPLAARAFIIPLLTDIAQFSNCTNILNAAQIKECSDIIVTEYYYLKLTELMLFCYKFKNGEYGQFYGSVSPTVILSSLRSFCSNDRSNAYFQHEQLIGEKRREEERKNAISYYEWKKKFNK